MASQWIHGEARRVLGIARSIAAGATEMGVETPVHLHFRRGELKPSPARVLDGYEIAIGLPLPLDKTDEELLEWLLWELKSVPCHPERAARDPGKA